MPNFDRVFWRAAQKIVTALDAQRRHNQELVLPVGSWTRLEDLSRQLRTARQRGWFAAAHQLHEAFLAEVEWIRTNFQRLANRMHPAQAQTLPPASAVYDELKGLRERFPGLEIDIANTRVSVITETIVLDDIDLGPFQLHWNWSHLADDQALRVVAASPYFPIQRDDVTHPHVQDEILCEGEAQAALQLARNSGRLCDYFEIVERVLLTYNPSSAYVALSDWNSQRCTGCGGSCDADDLDACEQCGEFCCRDCQTECSACHRMICGDCAPSCLLCDQPLCRTCRSTRARRVICPACLHKELYHDDDQTSSASAPAEDDTAVHADRLGEAAVPAGRR